MAEPLRAVDANVILRYLLTDVPEQADKARRLIDSELPLGLTAIALAEVAWTLCGPRYRRDRGIVAHELIDLLSCENIVTVGFDKAEAQVALLACAAETGSAGFGDALIAACTRSAGLDEICSFDRRFSRTGLIPVLPS